MTTLRHELPGLLNKLAGGWVTSSTYTHQTGDYAHFGGPLNVDSATRTGLAFHTKAFDTLAADQLQHHIRTFSTTSPNMRQDGINDWNVPLLKEVRLGGIVRGCSSWRRGSYSS